MSKKVRQKNTRLDFKVKKSLEIKKEQVSIGQNLRGILAKRQIENREVKPNKNLKQTYIPPHRKTPSTSLEATPEWFYKNQEVDISIIIPLYKSYEYVKEQIKSWDLLEDGLSKEIIYVDDCCPIKSKNAVLEQWETRKNEVRNGIGKIVSLKTNVGFSMACNIGAVYAKGKYLIFLNADTKVTPNWVQPMHELFQDNEVGIVGNMQLNSNQAIDSAGSEWSWQTKAFEHIGRNIYHGKRLQSPIKFADCPEDLLVVSEREMVTGCCFMIPRDLFMSIEGFDETYMIGYWEDSDICMKVRRLGYKIMYQPKSKIYHKVGHSKAGGHAYLDHNAKHFMSKWIHNGTFSNRVAKSLVTGKVIGCCIVCNEEEFLEASIESIAPIIDRFVVVVGGNQYALQAGMCDAKGYPTDSTLEICERLSNKFPMTIIQPPGRPWKDKVEMRNAYVDHLKPGNWMFMLDGDEVYKEDQLWRIANLMKEHDCLVLQFFLFWNNINTLGNGSWQKYPQERIVRWREGYAYRGSNHLNVTDTSGSLVMDKVKTFAGSEKLFYHYSWVRPIEKIKQKLDYYKYQIGNSAIMKEYLDEVFLKWRKDNSIQITHPRGGHSPTTQFLGIHPSSVQKMIKENKFDFLLKE